MENIRKKKLQRLSIWINSHCYDNNINEKRFLDDFYKRYGITSRSEMTDEQLDSLTFN